jgi:hypothetical protein
MTAAALVVLGAVIGAAATGSVRAWASRRDRILEREVAARAIFGDLFLLEALLQEMLTRREWPSHLDPNRPLDTWREFRAAFAAQVSMLEWSTVDTVYSGLHRLSLIAEPGYQMSESVHEFALLLSFKVEEALGIALKQAAPQAEWEELLGILRR